MGIFSNRIPSRRDILLVFAACVFPVHVWSILNLLRAVPAWVLWLSCWEVIGVVAYVQTFALIESVMILVVLVLLGAILPARLWRDRFVARSSMMVFVGSGCAIGAHFYEEPGHLWSLQEFFWWSVLFLASTWLFYLLFDWHRMLEESILSLVDRLAVLSLVYVSVDILSVIIVILRSV